MANQISLTAQQVQTVRSLTADGSANFFAGYRYIWSEIRHRNDVDVQTKFWFKKAADVNENRLDSAANTFIRGVTEAGLTFDGLGVDTQSISNEIGTRVIRDVLANGGVPVYPDLIRHDVSVALDVAGQTFGGWGGSMANWNFVIDVSTGETIGQWIIARPAELEKFIAANAKALNETLRTEASSADFELDTMIWNGIQSAVPLSVKFEILGRVVSRNFAGNPNMIGDWVYDQTSGQWKQGWVDPLTNNWVELTATGSEAANLNVIRELRLSKQNIPGLRASAEDLGGQENPDGTWTIKFANLRDDDGWDSGEVTLGEDLRVSRATMRNDDGSGVIATWLPDGGADRGFSARRQARRRLLQL
ncbi:MAG: hypothetical protein K0S06_2937 [Microvirga sp.]|nr:hypothetical protein [Microvirga sp.]